MNVTRFGDTNILLYSISRDPAEARRRHLAGARCRICHTLSGSNRHIYELRKIDAVIIEKTCCSIDRLADRTQYPQPASLCFSN